MKTKVTSITALRQSGAIKNCLLTCALALAAPIAALAQQTVFNDTFGSSTVGQPSIPGGTFTASSTSYDFAAPKAIASLAALGITTSPGHFNVGMLATSAAFIEAQAVFTTNPVTLAIPGDSIDVQYTFTDTTNIFNGIAGNSSSLALGLFKSGGSAPYTNLFNNGLVSTTTAQATGGVQNWVGYRGNLAYNPAGSANSATQSRPAQNQGNNLNQALINGFTGNVNLGQNGNTIAPLTVGNQYTVDFKITLQTNGSLTMTNTLYAGVGTGGAVLATNNAVASGANILTTNFDALVLGGERAGSGNPITTNDVNQIIITFTSTNQAGPYFIVGSTGNPCAGGVDITLNGSVTTNNYLLYTNGVFNGQSLAGTGSALDFGLQTVPAAYTVIASNPATGRMGPMYGSASVFAAGITINSQPASVTVVSNLPASFTVGATGASLSYQWLKNGVPLTNTANISGAQTATLNIAATGTGDAATAGNGYSVVIQTPCGNITTSAPPASLTLTQPRNLIWAGNDPFSAWDYTADPEFTLGGVPTAFSAGDNATFNDSSAFRTVTISNDVTSSFVSVVGAGSYTFTGPNKLTGVSTVSVGGSATLTILNNNNYTGQTTVSNGATLSIGSGTGVAGNLTSTVNVLAGGTLDYSSGASTITTTINMLNGFAGSGTINVNDAAGATYATAATGVINSNFTGTINVNGFTSLHASSGNAGYALGNGSTINVIGDNGNTAAPQIWLDPSATAYNNTFNIAGTGWQGVAAPGLLTGALRVFNCTVTGPINLMANARIGGTINGATIQSVISGPYQLEVCGNTNSFVLVLGPTNGLPQAYTSTLITAGSIQAFNSNAISSGPLTLDSGGDLRVFGTNITVANLSSINSGAVLFIEGPRVRNMNPTNTGTLTVGTDGTSTTFAGTFSDGAAAPFGLNKVGAGTLTLSLPSTNTGVVTVSGGKIALSGSGAFTKAVIAPLTGGSYDVTGVGGTLTLTSGQFLKGNGTVLGALSAPAGSIVQPGFPMGTLTVSGAATINGTYRANLNRTNVSNCSTFTAAGVTFSGATLSATNVGPKLQAGDVFQLFPSGTSGFSTMALPTTDPAHNAAYTWNNTVATDGKITVATAGFIVNPTPTPVTASVNGTTLTLNWPVDHTGWLLQAQTNTLAKGLGTNWVNFTNSVTVNQLVIPNIKTNASVFYRMVFTNNP